MTLFGWDASDFDWGRGPMDLAAAKADGITWFTHKATEATDVKHIHLADALNRARAAGIEFIGAYHVVRSSPSINEQVAYFLRYLDQVVPWWRTFPGFMLQVDLELWPYDQVSAATGAAFAEALQAAQPKRVITYASKGMYGNALTGIGTPLWNANYGGNPATGYRQAYPGDGGAGWAPYSGQVPVMWQYGSRLTIGSQPGCDANAFRGSLADLRQLITGSTPEEEDVQAYIIARDEATGQLYECSGMESRPVDKSDLVHIGTLAGLGLYKLVNSVTNGQIDVRPNWYPGAFGPVRVAGGGSAGGGPVELTPAAVAAVADAVADEEHNRLAG